MSRSTRNPTLWTVHKVSTRIRLTMPHRLTRIDTFRLLWIFCFGNHYSYPPETKYVGPDLSAWTAQADLGRYITIDRQILYFKLVQNKNIIAPNTNTISISYTNTNTISQRDIHTIGFCRMLFEKILKRIDFEKIFFCLCYRVKPHGGM